MKQIVREDKQKKKIQITWKTPVIYLPAFLSWLDFYLCIAMNY